MRVFVTGATGFIGTAVVKELLNAGHQVLGLARTEAGAQALIQMGAQAHRGSLEDGESLRRGAAAADGVIHLAFVHDLSHVNLFKRLKILLGGISRGIVTSFGTTIVELDASVIKTIGAELIDSNRPFVTVLGTLSLQPGKLATEQDAPDPSAIGGFRGNSEKLMLDLAAKGVCASVIRLPPTVHGDGDKAFIPRMIDAARKKGVSPYIGEGYNRWPAVHRLDAARLLRLALEQGKAGARYHGVAEEGIPIKDIAEIIGRHLKVPVVSKSDQEAAKHFGWLAMFLSVDNPSSSKWTQQQLQWQPRECGLVADLEEGSYFTKGSTSS